MTMETITTFTSSNPHDIEMLEAAARTKAEFAGVPKRKHTKVLKRVIDDADVVIGICVEDGKLLQRVIKGELRLDLIVKTKVSSKLCLRVIHVSCLEEAEAMRRVLGDGARLN